MNSKRGVCSFEVGRDKISELVILTQKQTYLDKQLQIESLEREREATLRLLSEAQTHSSNSNPNPPVREKSVLLEEARRRAKERLLLSEIDLKPSKKPQDDIKESIKPRELKPEPTKERGKITENPEKPEKKSNEASEFKHYIDKEYLQLKKELDYLRKGSKSTNNVKKIENTKPLYYEPTIEIKYKEQPTKDIDKQDLVYVPPISIPEKKTTTKVETKPVNKRVLNTESSAIDIVPDSQRKSPVPQTIGKISIEPRLPDKQISENSLVTESSTLNVVPKENFKKITPIKDVQSVHIQSDNFIGSSAVEKNQDVSGQREEFVNRPLRAAWNSNSYMPPQQNMWNQYMPYPYPHYQYMSPYNYQYPYHENYYSYHENHYQFHENPYAVYERSYQSHERPYQPHDRSYQFHEVPYFGTESITQQSFPVNKKITKVPERSFVEADESSKRTVVGDTEKIDLKEFTFKKNEKEKELNFTMRNRESDIGEICGFKNIEPFDFEVKVETAKKRNNDHNPENIVIAKDPIKNTDENISISNEKKLIENQILSQDSHTVEEKKPVKLEFGSQNKSLAEAFKEKNRKIVQKMNKREEKNIKQDHKEKTKEELIEIRKKLVKPPKIEKKTNNIIEILIDDKKNLKEPNSALMERLASGQRIKVSKEEMLKLNKKNYKLLPEVKKREEEEKKRTEKQQRLQKARDYEKNRVDKKKFRYIED